MIEIAFRLPLEGWPRAEFQSDFGYGHAQLSLSGVQILRAETRDELALGASAALPDTGAPISMQLIERGGSRALAVLVDGKPALREDELRALPTRSAWIHALIALAGSGAGFSASYFYLRKADLLHSAWALKMGQHTAGWHLLLTITLFPASVWGQRLGIRAVQLISLVFFFIHAGIALANADLDDPQIAFFNAASGALFLASALYGGRAHRDMDPVAALLAGRA